MRNCLVTKLKESVNNESLIKMNEILIGVNGSGVSNDIILSITPSNSITLVATTGGGMALSAAELISNPQQSITLNASQSLQNVYLAKANFNVKVGDKANILSITVNDNCSFNVDSLMTNTLYAGRFFGQGITGNIAKIKASTLLLVSNTNVRGNLDTNKSVGSITVENSPINGSLNKFTVNPTSYNNIIVMGCPISGDIVNLAGCTNFSQIQFGSTNVYGTVESLIEAFCENGISDRENTILGFNDTRATFHNSEMPNYTLRATFTSSEVVVKDNYATLLGTYNRSNHSWTYPE